MDVDQSRGVLRLPNEILFDKGSETPTEEGQKALGVLSDALVIHLPCYAFRAEDPPASDCFGASHSLDAVFIEGHTDSDPVRPTARIHDNWDLSLARASNILRQMLGNRPELSEFRNAPIGTEEALSVFSVAGYADQRPVTRSNSDGDQALNRRIDLRFVMTPPRPPEIVAPQSFGDGVEREPEPLPVGRRVWFRERGSGVSYLRDGWSSPEEWGVWTVGPSSMMALPLSSLRPDRRYEIAFSIVGYVPEESPSRQVQVLQNGQQVASWQMQWPTNRYEKVISVPAHDEEQTLQLEFRVPGAVSPLELGLSDDPRALGIGVSWVRLQLAE